MKIALWVFDDLGLIKVRMIMIYTYVTRPDQGLGDHDIYTWDTYVKRHRNPAADPKPSLGPSPIRLE